MLIELKVDKTNIILKNHIYRDLIKEDFPIIFKINFSKDWDNLNKYISFSSNSLNYTKKLLISQEEISVPEDFLIYPGFAVHFFGEKEEESKVIYRITTTFITYNIKGENLKWIIK